MSSAPQAVAAAKPHAPEGERKKKRKRCEQCGHTVRGTCAGCERKICAQIHCSRSDNRSCAGCSKTFCDSCANDFDDYEYCEDCQEDEEEWEEDHKYDDPTYCHSTTKCEQCGEPRYDDDLYAPLPRYEDRARSCPFFDKEPCYAPEAPTSGSCARCVASTLDEDTLRELLREITGEDEPPSGGEDEEAAEAVGATVGVQTDLTGDVGKPVDNVFRCRHLGMLEDGDGPAAGQATDAVQGGRFMSRVHPGALVVAGGQGALALAGAAHIGHVGWPRAASTRVFFSQDEVDALTEGVQRFSRDVSGREYVFGMWSSILSHYRSRFHPQRSSTDLKDKWRNMKRKEARLAQRGGQPGSSSGQLGDSVGVAGSTDEAIFVD